MFGLWKGSPCYLERPWLGIRWNVRVFCELVCICKPKNASITGLRMRHAMYSWKLKPWTIHSKVFHNFMKYSPRKNFNVYCIHSSWQLPIVTAIMPLSGCAYVRTQKIFIGMAVCKQGRELPYTHIHGVLAIQAVGLLQWCYINTIHPTAPVWAQS